MSIQTVPFTLIRKSFVDPTPAWGIDKGDGGVFVRCGQCGKAVDLHEQHTIAADGTVSPSVHHDEPGCGWHVHIKLEGWRSQHD